MRRHPVLAAVMLFLWVFLVIPLVAGDFKKVTLKVDGLSCPFCAYGLEKKLQKIDGVEKLDIHINDGVVVLYFKKDASVDSATIEKKVKEAGFTLRKIEEAP